VGERSAGSSGYSRAYQTRRRASASQLCDKIDRIVGILPTWMQSQLYQDLMGRRSWYEGSGRRLWCF
jgi:hypothetical protein